MGINNEINLNPVWLHLSFYLHFFLIYMKHLARALNVLTLSRCWKWKWDKHGSVPYKHLVWVSFRSRPESEWTPCRVARRRVQLTEARWSYLLTDDSCIVLSDSAVWKVLWIQSQMPPLLWYSCLDTKSTWSSIWSQHAVLHVRQLLSQKCVFLHLLLPPSCLCLFSSFLFISHLLRSSWKKFSSDLMVWITYSKLKRFDSINRTAKSRGNKCHSLELIHLKLFQSVNSVSAEFCLCVSSSNHFCRQSENSNGLGSPFCYEQPVEVTVTGRKVVVQSNYTEDDGWVTFSDWQDGYGLRPYCAAPWRPA